VKLLQEEKFQLEQVIESQSDEADENPPLLFDKKTGQVKFVVLGAEDGSTFYLNMDAKRVKLSCKCKVGDTRCMTAHRAHPEYVGSHSDYRYTCPKCHLDYNCECVKSKR